ncbi:RagB/SusD family nutrient uptake outer membrane protein [Alistipes sp. ZOR0009]|uniref:RagB/SusD family nutrient uptake outer membrane protein n=1 Tax=Alistipes sp. ZOR0009 TaxID=1339253 RepID=UPI0006488829|nr:RagB/SusD family nutrient uptake outer membrane protein [Alistipes sp. ZOR0009]
MKKYSFIVLLMVAAVFSSCSDDFLTSHPTDRQEVGKPATEGAIQANLASCYQVLLLDSYANNNYNSIVLMSDLQSDDIYKGGGDAGDQHQLYLLSQFTATPQEQPSGLWSIYFTGLARCNNALIACDKAVDVPAARLERYKAEAHFLRAYYVSLLWKFWGYIPYFEAPLAFPYLAKQKTNPDDIYKEIMEDIDFAAQGDKLPMSVSGAELGRVNKAAVLMLKARVVMYQKDVNRYAEVTNDMAEIITSGKYALIDATNVVKDEIDSPFAAMWKNNYEFCKENIFESNQLPEGKTWSSGWQGYGTNLPAFISPNGLPAAKDDEVGKFQGGWGFGPVREATWNIFEDGDTRREGSINFFEKGYTPRFQNTGYFMAKYAARAGYNPIGDKDLNFCNNLRIFRYAETLLNYAEMVAMNGQTEVGGISAQWCLDQIRKRAFGVENSIPATSQNIKLERRREFIGEGIRYWDLVRWGDAATVLTESTPLSTRVWTEGKKYLPIPQSEIDKTKGTGEFELKQYSKY